MSGTLNRAGFTLLEIMVALAIIATALVSLLSLHGRNIQVVANDQMLNRATFLAQQIMTRALVDDPFPDPTEDSGTFADDPQFSWSVRILKGPTADLEEMMREIEVRVLWDPRDPEGVRLITHVRGLPKEAAAALASGTEAGEK